MVRYLDKKAMGDNVILKLDMAKAYDRVQWEFLLHVLVAFGFSPSVSALIRNCIASPWYSIMMNGTSQGFLQGDPKKGSQFWKMVVKCIPAVLENSKWRVQDGNISIWWDHWLNEGPHANSFTAVDMPKLVLADLKIENDVRQGWKVNASRRKSFGGLFAKLVSWVRTRHGRVKLNVDGCSLGNPRSLGTGGIIRDLRGDMVLSFSCYLGEGSNNLVELKALLIGLKYYRALGLHHVDIESDSLVCVSWIQKKHCGV
ncbi:uncharacterized protein LOC121235407 [Juglans microcarpa x Juglans regia]|uniref:uncharacterized protein LOC121235407 n=1 Tax=Juglans microcarpa x Juglans regia TaxID=2249226 RepID=UPI001B7E504F|nr:uncharacterized protein LOC121235407 [Juglans microcarpa x Juglans regia]